MASRHRWSPEGRRRRQRRAAEGRAGEGVNQSLKAERTQVCGGRDKRVQGGCRGALTRTAGIGGAAEAAAAARLLCFLAVTAFDSLRCFAMPVGFFFVI